MRATNRVLIGSFAAASANASRAAVSGRAMISNIMRPGAMRVIHNSGWALAFAHAHFDGLLRHRHVGEDTDPDAASALHVSGERAAGGFDLSRRDALSSTALRPNSPKFSNPRPSKRRGCVL